MPTSTGTWTTSNNKYNLNLKDILDAQAYVMRDRVQQKVDAFYSIMAEHAASQQRVSPIWEQVRSHLRQEHPEIHPDPSDVFVNRRTGRKTRKITGIWK